MTILFSSSFISLTFISFKQYFKIMTRGNFFVSLNKKLKTYKKAINSEKY